MHKPNIYDFLSKPFTAVKSGYRPSYLDCVSFMAARWWDVAKTVGAGAAEFLDIWHMEVGEVFKKAMHLTFCLLIVVFFPLCMWPFAAAQYANIEHYIKALESEEDWD